VHPELRSCAGANGYDCPKEPRNPAVKAASIYNRMKSNHHNLRRPIAMIGLVFLFASVPSLRASSAVAVGTNKNGRLSFGYWKGDASESEAKKRALHYCVTMGWANPRIIDSTSRRGYGAVIWFQTADGRTHCAASSGARTTQQAISAALRKAKAAGGRYAVVDATWHDASADSRSNVIKL
jgi:hypothetical protein